MNVRINVILPSTTIAVLDTVAPKGSRSTFVNRAIIQYVKSQSRENLRRRLKQEALANADRDIQMTAEWYPLEEEAWQTKQGRKKRKN